MWNMYVKTPLFGKMAEYVASLPKNVESVKKGQQQLFHLEEWKCKQRKSKINVQINWIQPIALLGRTEGNL